MCGGTLCAYIKVDLKAWSEKMKKLLTAGLISLTMTGTAVAQDVYLDIGADYSDPDTAKAAGVTTTGWKNELLLDYYSQSYVKDVDNSGDLSAGDTIHSAGGLIPASVDWDDTHTITDFNSVGGFTPGQGTPPDGSNNGYTNDWLISFRFDDLMGTFNGTDFIYSSGTIDWLIFDSSDGWAEHHLFTTTITGHTATSGNQIFSGGLSNFGADVINGVSVGDIFNIETDGGAISFEDYNTDNSPFEVQWRIDQNTDQPVFVANAGYGLGGNFTDYKFMVESAKHNGSLAFTAVPEPASIALFGLALVGLAGATRRKA